MSRLSVEIEGQVFEPKQLGVLRGLWCQAAFIYYTDKAGWSIPDSLEFKTAVAGAELETFYGKDAADTFDEVVRKKPFWRWEYESEPRRKVLFHDP